MTALLAGLAQVFACLTLIGLCTTLAGTIAVHRFGRRVSPDLRASPPVTLLRPLCGDEPFLFEALASLCRQDYPHIQIVLGVQDHADPAISTVRKLQALFPAIDITLVIDAAMHGRNRKVSNLINMLPAARHGLLVCSDSDIHVAPDYLRHVVAALQQPGTGLVTTLCLGQPTAPGLAARLGAIGITHTFLPGVLLSRAMGREDCLGTTMAVEAAILARIGGFGALVSHLADDYVLSERIRRLGLRIGLATTVPKTAVPETRLRALWQHELRWARTIRAVEPLLYATTILQYPIFWAVLAAGVAGGARWSLLLLVLAWATRAIAAQTNLNVLAPRQPLGAGILLLPVRDMLSAAQSAASYLGGRVVWRGTVLRADNGNAPPLTLSPEPPIPEP